MQAFDFGLPNLMIQRIGEAQGRGDAAQVAEIERQLRDARHNAALRVEVEYRESANREAMLKKAVAETKAELDRLNARSFDYQSLKREAEADKNAL
jgi:uncharacterized protein involved in exopolysaccharide biosynthesis